MANTILKIIEARFSQAATTDDQWSESADLIGSNVNILTEILLRLPATSIIRFKSVSKQWWSLLTHKLYTVRYDSLLKSPGSFADGDVYVPFDVENPPPFPSCHHPCGIRIMQSCNGLLLCHANVTNRNAWKYYVCNPTTKQFAEIPPILGYSAKTCIYYTGLAFHPRDCVHYKVVCILHLERDSQTYHIQTYSSDTGKWKVSDESFFKFYPTNFTHPKGVYWNGAIHWVIHFNKHIYFDVIFQRLQTCPSTKELLSSNNVIRYFGESRGHLHLIVSDDKKYYDVYSNPLPVFRSSAFKVYEMLNDHSGWFVKYQVELHELMDAFPEMIFCPYGYYYDVMDVVSGEKERDTFMVLRIPNKMIRYNIHEKSFKQICNNIDNHLCDRKSNFYRHTEALTSF